MQQSLFRSFAFKGNILKLQFDHLSNISITDIIELNTHYRVLRHMPLAHGIILDEARWIV